MVDRSLHMFYSWSPLGFAMWAPYMFTQQGASTILHSLTLSQSL